MTGKFQGRSAAVEELMSVEIRERQDKLMEMATWYRRYNGREEVRDYVWRMETGEVFEMSRRDAEQR